MSSSKTIERNEQVARELKRVGYANLYANDEEFVKALTTVLDRHFPEPSGDWEKVARQIIAGLNALIHKQSFSEVTLRVPEKMSYPIGTAIERVVRTALRSAAATPAPASSEQEQRIAELEHERLEIQRAIASSRVLDPTEDDDQSYTLQEILNWINRQNKRHERAMEMVVKEREKVAALEASKPAEGAWQDIATAPKELGTILLWWPYWNLTHAVMGRWFHDHWYSRDAKSADGDGPTHWMPLPAPPKEAE